ncbi:uncharacterized protein LOC112511126 [Cynara cardunculus var. scolymus]|uniref:Uncharacterized protein n=1 Tax=Cynara cardunculus var. scolymus TaxID=59895 RepID=A0A124SE20_CYNCS|nr:uncharacterized protein LOC112511126 [Cynara cardunculus var. scolymus]KVH98722.1 hypothetical protein Ccrd_023050 [Cynara cardunculus var. scolymus]
MSMLEVITKASVTSDQLTSESQYPIVLNPDSVLLNLKPQTEESNDASFIKRVEGWKISQTDTEVIELGQKFFKKLKIKLKNPNSFSRVEFISIFNSYLEKNSEKLGISIGIEPKDEGYTKVLVQNVGFVMGQAVVDLVLEACFAFEIWEILEPLIVGGLVDGPCSKNLVRNSIEKRRSDLVCFCVKHVSDLQVSDILSVLKFFLSPPKDAYTTMNAIRKEWEIQALSAMKMAVDKTVGEKNSNLAKDDVILLMLAYDQFTVNELCLHYLLASPNLDDVIFPACIGQLNGSEIMGLLRYLKKWLEKYQKFPQACQGPKAPATHGLKASELVPSLEHVTKCFGLVLDEHFSSLVMHPEFCEEVISIELIVNSLVSEARLCCTLANLTSSLKTDVKGTNY